MLHELFKALLIDWQIQISRADLDNGVCAEEQLWKAFVAIYNQTDLAIAVMELNELKYEIDWNGNKPDPSQFHPIDWKKA